MKQIQRNKQMADKSRHETVRKKIIPACGNEYGLVITIYSVDKNYIMEITLRR